MACFAWIIIIGGGWWDQEIPGQSPPSVGQLRARLDRNAGLKFRNGAGEEMVLSLKQGLVSGPDGRTRVVKFPEVASVAALGKRLAETHAEPLAISPDGRKQIVTRDLVVNLDGPESGILSRFPELVFRARPDFAPGWFILRAADPLAALAVLSELRATPGVTAAMVSLARQQLPRTLPDDPLLPSQWHLKTSGIASPGTDLNVENVWNYGGTGGIRGNGIRIGVVDDGLEQSHPDLVQNVDAANGWDWNGNDSNPAPGSGDRHGTACAGLAAARGDNSLGGSGAAPEAGLVGMRLIAAPSTDEQEAEAMLWKKDLIQVKSCSWGPDDTGKVLEGPGPLTLAALETATATGRQGRGTLFVWAAGNGRVGGDNSNYDGYANSIHTIATAAIDSTGNAAYYSEAGANLVVCAPSDGTSPALGITTTDLTGTAGYNGASSAAGGDYADDFGGTSAAAPLVAGVIALMLEGNPLLGWRDVQEILIASAIRIRPTDSGWATNGAGFHFHPRFGAGLVDAATAVAMASTWQNLYEQQAVAQTVSGPGAIPENSSAGHVVTFHLAESNLRAEQVTLTADISHTSRGNLEIILTSPTGTVSRLAEVHNDLHDDYPAWTFSSVRSWGESADGDWTLKICDLSSDGNSTGGILNHATLRVFGSHVVPQNPPPMVAIVSPVSGAVFSPGSTVAMTVAASDLTSDGSPGSIAEILIAEQGQPLTALTSGPYDFHLVLPDGAHELIARATDSEGAVSYSQPVTVILENRPPVLAGVTLNAIGEAFSDRDLRVLTVSAMDTDGQSITFSYQWQSNRDGLTWQDAAGEITDRLPVSPSRDGKLWRCQVTASDGMLTSPPLASPAVNLLARPASQVPPGQSYAYTSGLVVAGTPDPPVRNAILHEFSQGPAGGNSEWVEILVLNPTDFRYWDLSDSTNTLVFKYSDVWKSLPAGTLVVVYNGNTVKDPALPADDADPSDGRMVVASTDPIFFASGFDSWIPLSNNGDSISLNDASSNRVHSLSYGSASGPGFHLAAVGSGTAARFTGDTGAAADDATAWNRVPASGSVTPGASNGPVNAVFVDALRSGHPVIPARFSIVAGSLLPAGLSLDPVTGSLSGSVTAALGSYEIRLQRTNDVGGIASQSFVLNVGSITGYDAWLGGFPGLTDLAPAADSDGDGFVNLIEYAVGSDPTNPDPPLMSGDAAAEISLQYQQSRLHTDVDLMPEWTATPDSSSSWDSAGIEILSASETANHRILRASLAVDPAMPRRFLRLRATLIP